MTDRLFMLIAAASLLFAGCAGSGRMRTPSAEAPETQVQRDIPSPDILDHVIAGSVFESEGQYLLALHEYNRALLRDSTSAELYHATAEMHSLLGDDESARLVLEKGVQVCDDLSLLTHLGEIQMQQQKYSDAIATFTRLLQADRHDESAMEHLAVALGQAGQPANALAMYDSLLALPSADEEAILMRKVTLLSALQRYDEAIAVYRRLQLHRPEEDRIPFFVGSLYLDMGDTTSAIESVAAATRMCPVEPRYWDLWIRLEVVTGHKDRALELADSAMSFNPGNAPIYSLAASVFTMTDHKDKAEDALKRAIELEPENPEHLLNLGYLYHDQKRWNDAEQLYQKALKLDPGNAQIMNNYAYLLAEQGVRLDEALELSEDAVSMEPDNPSFLDTKGWILFRQQKYEEARGYIEHAHELDPNHYEILDHLGDVYAALGMEEKAREMWRKSLEAGGDEIEITRKLED